VVIAGADVSLRRKPTSYGNFLKWEFLIDEKKKGGLLGPSPEGKRAFLVAPLLRARFARKRKWLRWMGMSENNLEGGKISGKNICHKEDVPQTERWNGGSKPYFGGAAAKRPRHKVAHGLAFSKKGEVRTQSADQ